MSFHPRRTPFAELSFAAQAGIMCNCPQFQRFAATRCGAPAQTFSPSAAAEYLRQVCQITSRRELSTDSAAQQKFQILRTEFDAWTGKIAAPR